MKKVQKDIPLDPREGCPKCGVRMVAVEYALTDKYHYDGVSEYACPKGHYREGRWCGQQLEDNQVESAYCTGKGHVRVFTITD